MVPLGIAINQSMKCPWEIQQLRLHSGGSQEVTCPQRSCRTGSIDWFFLPTAGGAATEALTSVYIVMYILHVVLRILPARGIRRHQS